MIISMKISHTFRLGNNYNPAICFLALFYFMIGSYNPVFLGFNLSNFVLLFIAIIMLVFPCNRVKLYRLPVILLGAYYLFSFIFLDPDNITHSLSVYLKILMPLMAMCIFCIIFKSNGDMVIFNRILLYTNLIACLVGLFNFFILEDYGYTMMVDGVFVPRMRGSFLQPNVFSMYIILTFPFMVWELNKKKKYEKRKIVHTFFYYSMLAINIFCLYMSRSRWGTVCAIVAYICSFIIDRDLGKKVKLVISIIIALLLGVALLSLANHQQLFYRESNSLRIESILIAFDLILDNLFFGSGIGNSFVIYDSLGFILDSTYLNIMLDSGLIGIILFIVINTMAIFCLLNKTRKNREFYPVLLVSIMLITGCFLENIFYNSLINSFFGITWYYGFKVITEQ